MGFFKDLAIAHMPIKPSKNHSKVHHHHHGGNRGELGQIKQLLEQVLQRLGSPNSGCSGGGHHCPSGDFGGGNPASRFANRGAGVLEFNIGMSTRC